MKHQHDLLAKDANIVLLYNDHYVNGNYIATVKAKGDNFITTVILKRPQKQLCGFLFYLQLYKYNLDHNIPDSNIV